MPRKTPEQLRSHRWYGVADLRSFGHRSRTKQMGYAEADWKGKPVIGILNTWSDINPCHQHFRIRAEEVKRGVWQAGGFPLEIPVLALAGKLHEADDDAVSQPAGDGGRRRSRARCRSMASMLMGGCDKTTPAHVDGRADQRGPAVRYSCRPGRCCADTANGAYPGFSGSGHLEILGRVARRHHHRRTTGEAVEDGIARSWGTCMTMGTASTMTAAAEALGLALPGSSSIPAADSNHAQNGDRLRPARRGPGVGGCSGRATLLTRGEVLITRRAWSLALGGSDQRASIHLIAMARRAGLPLGPRPLRYLSEPADAAAGRCAPGRRSILMEDFYYAGGLRGAADAAGRRCWTWNPPRRWRARRSARKLWQVRRCWDARPSSCTLDNPRCAPTAGLAVLRGNLAPDGAVIKHSRRRGRDCCCHTGRGGGVRRLRRASRRSIDNDPDLPVTPDSVLVLRGAGPVGAPGMPEWGMLPLPKKLLRQGVRDMVRISDSRMSGTSYGTCVLHVAPESAVGGPLALVRTGDLITLDVAARRISLDVPEAELATRRAAWTPPPPRFARGFGLLHSQQVRQANEGCDYAVLEGTMPTAEPEIH